MTDELKFSTATSEFLIRSRSTERPSADRVSSVKLRLLRLTSLKYQLVLGLSCGPRERCMNGAKRVGYGSTIDSTLMTSAQRSARILVTYGRRSDEHTYELQYLMC